MKTARKSDERFFTPWRLGLIGVFLTAVATYLPCLGGLPIWDDTGILYGPRKTLAQVLTEPFLQHYWRPLTSLSYWTDRALFGRSPFFCHQTSLLIHAVTALLVCWLALTLVDRKGTAIIAGLLFAVQPAQVMATGWIGGRTDALAAMFGAFYAVALIKWLKTSHPGWLAASATALLAAMLSKEQAAALALAAPFAALWFGKQASWKHTSLVLGAALVAFLVLWRIYWVQEEAPVHWGVDRVASLLATSAANYSLVLFAPNPWSMNAYTPSVYSSPGWGALGVALLAIGCYALFRWRKARPELAWLLLLAILAWLPGSGIAPVPSFLLGPYRVAICGVFVAPFLAILLRPTLALPYAAGCLALTVWGCRTLSDPVAFFSEVVARDPSLTVAGDNLAVSYLDKGDYPRALAASEANLDVAFGSAAWRSCPTSIDASVSNRYERNYGYRCQPQIDIARFYARYAEALAGLHRSEEALQAYDCAVNLAPSDQSIAKEAAEFKKKTARAPPTQGSGTEHASPRPRS